MTSLRLVGAIKKQPTAHCIRMPSTIMIQQKKKKRKENLTEERKIKGLTNQKWSRYLDTESRELTSGHMISNQHVLSSIRFICLNASNMLLHVFLHK